MFNKKALISFIAALAMLLSALPVGAAGGSTTHVVQKLESWSDLSWQYGVSIGRLLEANGVTLAKGENLADKKFWLTPGQTVTVPIEVGTTPSRVNPFWYTVKAGDTLGLLTVRLEISATAVAKFNGLDAKNLTAALTAGERLFVPAGPHYWKLEKNEKLADVAALYGVSAPYLLKVNSLGTEADAAGKLLTIPVQFDRALTPMISLAVADTAVKPAATLPAIAPTVSSGPLTIRWVGQGTDWKTGDSGPTATFFVEFKGGAGPFKLSSPQWGAIPFQGPYTVTDNGETWTRLEFSVTAKCGETFTVEPNLLDATGAKAWTLRQFTAACK